MHDRLIKCLFDSTLKRDQKLVPWLTAELEERLRDEPKGVDQASSQEQRDAIYYRWRSVMELATSKGVRMETQFTTEVAMEENILPEDELKRLLDPVSMTGPSS